MQASPRNLPVVLFFFMDFIPSIISVAAIMIDKKTYIFKTTSFILIPPEAQQNMVIFYYVSRYGAMWKFYLFSPF